MKRIIPEVIQTSAMDCGPACLASLLGGFGVTASYERLREACRTDVDGTSIDTIEEAAIQLGLGAEQNLVPADEVVRAEAAALPAIVIVREPSGSNHFIVVWSRRGSRLQVMDPAVGRRWLTAPQLVSDLYVHTMDLPAAVWRGWMDNDERTAPLRARLRELAIADGAQRVDRALADPTWRSIATLDAAARFVQQLVDAAAIGTRETTALLDAVIAAPSA
ncbi:MAG: ABC transporter permease, partial [Myxococcales bacterium]|nr:ABC transporter permease [Myxococcales bacterium]